jgi:hypothetical protein
MMPWLQEKAFESMGALRNKRAGVKMWKGEAHGKGGEVPSRNHVGEGGTAWTRGMKCQVSGERERWGLKKRGKVEKGGAEVEGRGGERRGDDK